MGQAEILLAALLVAVVGLSVLASRLSVPYPILLVLGGALFGLIPGVPQVELDPEIVLVLFLPPLLYKASFFSNFNDFRADLRALTLSTIPLVLATMSAVAVVAHAVIPGMSWQVAFVLGSIVSPTDPVAASTILRRLEAPRRLVSAIEGEGLFNDATALVAYRVAVAAVVAGSFSLVEAGLRFVLGIVGGVAIGLAVGWLSARIRARTSDAQVSIAISLLTGYAAFVPANALGVSGVVSTVTAGLYMAVRGSRVLTLQPRLQGFFVWDIVDFLVNAILFVLIGLQLRAVVGSLGHYSGGEVAGYAAAVVAVVVGIRLVWFFTVPYLIRALDRRPSQRARRASAGWRLVMAWSGMRGAVSLAVALALPFSTVSGPFPQRDLIIFLTFVVILVTLVLQGLTLPALIRRAGVNDGGAEADEETRARLVATKAALHQIDVLAEEDWTRDESVERMRGQYQFRKQRLAARAGKIEDDGVEDQSQAYQRMVRCVLAAQRTALLEMRAEGKVSNEMMNRLQRELDFEESRLDS
ncbi:MAG: monovalent cation/hydrogen antiporter [Mycobacterium sp.]|jgi:CPA1 family monovalent cation:H+ antiporter|nr:monovalent cation/hydrogen antiporter [Mycobacterium sp.]